MKMFVKKKLIIAIAFFLILISIAISNIFHAGAQAQIGDQNRMTYYEREHLRLIKEQNLLIRSLVKAVGKR